MSIRRVLFVGSARNVHLAYWARLLVEVGIQVDLVNTLSVEHPWTFGDLVFDWPRHARGPLRQAWNGWRAARAVKRFTGADLLHAHYAGKPAWIAAATCLPLVVSAWGSDIMPGSEYASPWMRRLTDRALLRADLVTAHTPALLARLAKIGVPASKTRLVPWGVDTVRFHPAPPAIDWRARLDLGNGPVALCLRFTEPVYRTREIVAAFARAAERLPDARLIVRGDVLGLPYKDAVRSDVERLGVAAKVRFVDWLSPEELADLYRAADFGLSWPESDGYPLSVQEAMCCGLPPILGDLPNLAGLAEHEHNALIVDSHGPAALSRAIERLLRDTPLRNTLRAALAGYAANIAPPAECRRHLLEAYEQAARLCRPLSG